MVNFGEDEGKRRGCEGGSTMEIAPCLPRGKERNLEAIDVNGPNRGKQWGSNAEVGWCTVGVTSARTFDARRAAGGGILARVGTLVP